MIFPVLTGMLAFALATSAHAEIVFSNFDYPLRNANSLSVVNPDATYGSQVVAVSVNLSNDATVDTLRLRGSVHQQHTPMYLAAYDSADALNNNDPTFTAFVSLESEVIFDRSTHELRLSDAWDMQAGEYYVLIAAVQTATPSAFYWSHTDGPGAYAFTQNAVTPFQFPTQRAPALEMVAVPGPPSTLLALPTCFFLGRRR
jgi:hypothetical protein